MLSPTLKSGEDASPRPAPIDARVQDSCICGQDYTSMSRARCCILNVKYSNVDQITANEVIPVVLCFAS